MNNEKYPCKDCGQDMGKRRGSNHEYCERCISKWYADNDIEPNEIPNGDFDDDGFNQEEY